MSSKKRIPATHDRIATINLTSSQKANVNRLVSNFFSKTIEYPDNIRLIISDDEVISEEARRHVKGNVLEVPFKG